MEAILLNSSSDRSIYSHKQFGSSFNAKKNSRILTSSNVYGGILQAPPFSLSSYSYPPSVSVFHPQLQQRQQQQPPLLPIPIPKPNTNPRNRGISCPPINRKINNKSIPRKSKPTVGLKKADPKCLMVVSSSANRLGPDPNNLPKNVSGVLSSSSVGFTPLSPPPSSLPLPTFSLRPKLRCNAEAAGIDAGATDNLRRMLRLR